MQCDILRPEENHVKAYPLLSALNRLTGGHVVTPALTDVR